MARSQVGGRQRRSEASLEEKGKNRLGILGLTLCHLATTEIHLWNRHLDSLKTDSARSGPFGTMLCGSMALLSWLIMCEVFPLKLKSGSLSFRSGENYRTATGRMRLPHAAGSQF